LHLNATDGVKLLINSEVLVDALSAQGNNTYSPSISMTAGEKYAITLEYSSRVGSAHCAFEWESASQGQQIIPQIQFYSEVERPLSSTGLITLFSECDYGGFSGALKVGKYNAKHLKQIGVYDNDIASIQIADGFKVILYEEDDFKGESYQLNGDVDCLDAWSDRATSIEVKTDGVTDLEGRYFIKNRESNLYMDVTGGIGAVHNGANVQQWKITPNINQQFDLTHLGDGSYKISAVHSNKALEISNLGSSDGDNLHQWTYYGLDNQQFIVKQSKVNDYYYFVCKHSGKVLKTEGDGIEANVSQWTNNALVSSQWKLVPVPELINGTGMGLDAKYYNGTDFESLRATKVDETIDFNWGNGAPNNVTNRDDFSVRWTGKIQPRFSSEYTFYVNSDNGRRLWINDVLIIDEWTEIYDEEYTGKITLSANQLYNIKMEYYEGVGGAHCKLEWSSRQQLREVVPQSQLYTLSSKLQETSFSKFGIRVYPQIVTDNKCFIQQHSKEFLSHKMNVNLYNMTDKWC
jgi:hypothetical protein